MKELYSDYYKSDNNRNEWFYERYTDAKESADILTYVNYMTLLGKDNYVILRPELATKEEVSISITNTKTTDYKIGNNINDYLKDALIEIVWSDGEVNTYNFEQLNNTKTSITISDNNDYKTEGQKIIGIKYKNKETGKILETNYSFNASKIVYTISYKVENETKATTKCKKGETVTLKAWSELEIDFPNNTNGWTFAGWSNSDTLITPKYDKNSRNEAEIRLNLHNKDKSVLC